jgi:hypothetical protein
MSRIMKTSFSLGFLFENLTFTKVPTVIRIRWRCLQEAVGAENRTLPGRYSSKALENFRPKGWGLCRKWRNPPPMLEKLDGDSSFFFLTACARLHIYFHFNLPKMQISADPVTRASLRVVSVGMCEKRHNMSLDPRFKGKESGHDQEMVRSGRGHLPHRNPAIPPKREGSIREPGRKHDLE